MGTPGKTVLLENGKRGLLSSGKAAVFNSSGECETCCGGGSNPDCFPHVVASRTAFWNGSFGWEISDWQNNPAFFPNSRWRLVQAGPDICVVAAEGDVDGDGIAVGFPRLIYTYYWYPNSRFEIQNGCQPNDFTTLACASTEYVEDEYIVVEY